MLRCSGCWACLEFVWSVTAGDAGRMKSAGKVGGVENTGRATSPENVGSFGDVRFSWQAQVVH